MKFAYFGIPQIGGTYTVYNSLRTGLAHHGISVKWLGVGPNAQSAFDNPQWEHEREHGIVIAGQIDNDRLQAKALIQHLESSDFDGVFINVLAGRVETNAMRYLDCSIKRVMIVHSITPGTYAAARTVRDYVHATIGVSPRIQQDLVSRHGFRPANTHAIPNAIDLSLFEESAEYRSSLEPLRLLFLGRVVDADKGVFWLPELVQRLPRSLVQLTVVGDGADLPALKARFASKGFAARFVGRVSAEQVPGILASHDVFIFPSRFEGLPLSLVEAMAAGCVPVATRLKNVTDFVVTDGRDGFLFPMGDMAAAATAVERLARERATLARMSLAAKQGVKGRFELAAMAQAYKALIDAVVLQPITLAQTLPMHRWNYPAGLRRGLRSHLPAGVKNVLRRLRESFA